jgi:DNA-binding NtrC family response regulator
MIDFGKFQTSNAKFIHTLQKAEEAAAGQDNFLILGEAGTGRRLMAEFLHENNERSFANLVRYSAERDLDTVVAVLIENIQFLNSLEQTDLLEKMQNPILNIKWYATASPNVFDLIERGFVKREFASLFTQKIQMPTLVERHDDILPLAEQMLATVSWLTGRLMCLSQDAKIALQNYEWPENIRELETAIEAAAVKSNGPMVQAQDFEIRKEVQWSFAEVTTLAEMERKLIMQTLHLTKNNKTQAAKLLGISIRTLRNKLTQYRVEGGYEPIV